MSLQLPPKKENQEDLFIIVTYKFFEARRGAARALRARQLDTSWAPAGHRQARIII